MSVLETGHPKGPKKGEALPGGWVGAGQSRIPRRRERGGLAKTSQSSSSSASSHFFPGPLDTLLPHPAWMSSQGQGQGQGQALAGEWAGRKGPGGACLPGGGS